MASKTFCDRCHEEIAAKKGRVTKFLLQIDREEEPAAGEDGRVVTDEQLRKELCRPCRDAVGKAIAFFLKR